MMNNCITIQLHLKTDGHSDVSLKFRYMLNTMSFDLHVYMYGIVKGG